MGKHMKLTNQDLVRTQLEKIQHLQEAQEAFYTALRVAQRLQQGYLSDTVQPGNAGEILSQAELEEWRKLFMWALTLTDPERDSIKALAHARFMADSASVAQWLESEMVDGWLDKDKEEFRAMARKHFGNVYINDGRSETDAQEADQT